MSSLIGQAYLLLHHVWPVHIRPQNTLYANKQQQHIQMLINMLVFRPFNTICLT